MSISRTRLILLAMVIALLGLNSMQIAQASQSSDGQHDVIPKVGVFITAEDIQNARELAKTQSWAQQEAQTILDQAAFWLQKPDQWFYDIMPPKGSKFAYGQSGCPIDGSPWGNFGEGGVADFSRPYTLKCPNGDILDLNDSSSRYYDAGDGITINGVKYYLRGIWNAFVTNTLAGWGNDRGAVYYLAYAYALTGDERYAHKATVILDALATLSPTTKGPRDFERSPNSDEGRLHWLTSIVYRSRMHLINAYDILYNYVGMDEDSPSNPGQTIHRNIENGLFLDYVMSNYNMRDGQLTSLHNHEADAVRGMLGVGILLGIPDYITWGINAITRFFDNTIDRDGLYYETSLGYSAFSQSVFLSMAELAYNYSPDNYEGAGFPARSDFPYNANFYDHPKLQKFLVGFRDRVDLAGFEPGFGDGHATLEKKLVFNRPLENSEWIALEHFALRASNPEDRARFIAKLKEESGGDIDMRRSGRWLLFHAHDYSDASVDTAQTAEGKETELLGGTEIGMLRSGEPPFQRAAFMRGGVTLPHGHNDVLGLLLFGKGYDLNTEIGYGIYGSPVHMGWGTTGIAHDMVVVNKGLNKNGSLFEIGPGSDVLAFVKDDTLSGMEMDAASMFEKEDGVSQYQRGVWQIDVSSINSYWVDVFRVTGGQTHDYSFHSLGFNPIFEGVEVKEIPNVWTLQGLDDPDASYDAPGRSWAERIIPGEGIKDLGVASEGVKSRYWTPAPGNGYGFIYDLKGGEPAGDWTATWRIIDTSATRFRLTMLEKGGAQNVYNGYGPDLSGKRRYGWIVGRREAEENLQSRFVSVLQVYTKDRPIVTDVAELPLTTGDDQAVAMRLTLGRDASGVVDYILSNPRAGIELVASDGDTELETDAMFALVRIQDGEVSQFRLVGGTKLRYGDYELSTEKASYSGTVESADYAGRRLITSEQLPVGTLAGSTVVFSNPEYSTNTAYKVAGITELGDGKYAIELGNSPLELARSEVDRVAFGGRVLTQKAPLPTASEYNTDTGYLKGKAIVSDRSGATGTIHSVPAMKSVRLAEPAEGFEPGDSVVIYDVKPGDSFEILTQVSLVKEGESWQEQGSVPAQLENK